MTWWNRLRIERLVWMLDQQLYDLPRQSRIATRREVRANLLDAARDIGTGPALRRVGGSRRLARQYLDAELGDGPRHSWIAAAYVAGLTPLLLNYVFAEVAGAYQAGLTADRPPTAGTFTGPGLAYLQSPITVTFTDGQAARFGGAWTPLTYVLWILAVIAAGRLWRLARSRTRGGSTSAGRRR